jgi:hypothetical protein
VGQPFNAEAEEVAVDNLHNKATMTITYFSIQTARWLDAIVASSTPTYSKLVETEGYTYTFDCGGQPLIQGNLRMSTGIIRMLDMNAGQGWFSSCNGYVGPLAIGKDYFRLNVGYLHDCRLIDKDLYATELAKRPAPLALHHALKAARNSLVPTHALVRPYGAELSLLIDYLLAHPLKLNNKGNYGYARSDKRRKIILHNTPNGIRYEGAYPLSENVLNVDYLEKCDLVNRADYELSAISGNYVEALIYALRKKHTDEDVQLSKVIVTPMENVDSNLFGE